MEQLVSLAKEVFQGVAEHAASYRLGQSALRHLDRSLWVVEKCARWAVPPPLDQDERPQPELVRPLPWVFFLVMLVALRVTRESISLLNLVMGKPPLRSADVVMYIQSKRRYLRTLKYQGNRMLRARTCASTRDSTARPWYSSANSLLELTMCFRRNAHYGNNNTTDVSNNEQVLVVKRSKRGREQSSAGSSETTMERLIEKMMVDLDADSDDDSSFTLTNVTSAKSDRSELTTESDQETICLNNVPNENRSDSSPETPFSPLTGPATSSTPQRTPEKASRPEKTHLENNSKEQTFTVKKSPANTPKENSIKTSPGKTEEFSSTQQIQSSPEKSSDKSNQSLPNESTTSDNSPQVSKENVPPRESTKELTNNFILNEAASSKIPRTPKSENKIANGRTVKSAPSKKKGSPMVEKERRINSDTHVSTNHQGSPNNTL